MIIVIFIILLVAVYVAYFVLSIHRMDKISKAIPTVPSSFPLIGHALMFVGNTQKILKNVETIANMAMNHNTGICKIWLGPRMYVAIGNPEDAQAVLENCLDKDGVYRFLRPWLGDGLFVAPLNLWKCHRKVLLPIFNNKIVEEYLRVISDQADVMIQRLKDRVDQDHFDVLKYITACTLDIVFETAMGEKMDVQHSPDTPYLRARNTVMTILNMRLFKVWLQPDFIFNLTPYAKQQRQNIELTHKFTDEVVKKRRIEYENNKDSTNYTTDPKPGKLRAVVDLLFGREIDFTDEQLREHIDSITIAGNDTTALVIAYTLVLLGVHQDSQEMVLEEQRQIFGESLKGSSKEDLQKMHYLERVIKESMRMYTVVPIIARNVEKDTYLPYSGVTLPAGSGAVVGSFAIHRSEKVWGPNVNEYDPDRFLPERSSSRHPASFLPFSFGSRNCIGRNFGMLIMKSIISTFIRSYAVKANNIGELKIEMLLFPINGHLIKIEKRKLNKLTYVGC